MAGARFTSRQTRNRFERLVSATGPSKEDDDQAGTEPAPVPAGPPV